MPADTRMPRTRRVRGIRVSAGISQEWGFHFISNRVMPSARDEGPHVPKRERSAEHPGRRELFLTTVPQEIHHRTRTRTPWATPVACCQIRWKSGRLERLGAHAADD